MVVMVCLSLLPETGEPVGGGRLGHAHKLGAAIVRIANRRKNDDVSVPVEDSARGHVKTREGGMALHCSKVKLNR